MSVTLTTTPLYTSKNPNLVQIESTLILEHLSKLNFDILNKIAFY